MHKGGIPIDPLSKEMLATSAGSLKAKRLSTVLINVCLAGVIGAAAGILLDSSLHPDPFEPLIKSQPSLAFIAIGCLLGMAASFSLYSICLKWDRPHIRSVMRTTGIIPAVLNAGPGNLIKQLAITPPRWMAGINELETSSTHVGRLIQVCQLYAIHAKNLGIKAYSRFSNAAWGINVTGYVLYFAFFLYQLIRILVYLNNIDIMSNDEIDFFNQKFLADMGISISGFLCLVMLMLSMLTARFNATRLALIDILNDPEDGLNRETRPTNHTE